jgi:hypothetical protein
MNKENMRWTVIILGVVIVLAAVGYFTNLNPVQAPSNIPDSANNSEQIKANASSLEGILKRSDDVEKGNLLLVMPDKKIYLNTTRDFNQLTDKQVTVYIEGTVENFILLDIKEK